MVRNWKYRFKNGTFVKVGFRNMSLQHKMWVFSIKLWDYVNQIKKAHNVGTSLPCVNLHV